MALNGFSNCVSNIFNKYGYTKNLKQAAEDIGLPGRPKKDLLFDLNLANKKGLPGLIDTPLK